MFDFFKNRTESGLVLDRESNPSLVSVSATGFAMDCWALLASKTQAIEYINQAIDATVKYNYRGWLYHFTDTNGTPLPNSEISTIDSTIFYLSARQAARRINDKQTIDKVENLISQVDYTWMLEDGYFRHGWVNNDFISFSWKVYSEGMMIYKLFNIPYTPTVIDYSLPLFVFYYPLCFFKDDYIVEHLRKAIQFQIDKYGYWGISACDGPDGYGIYDDIICPLSIWAVSKYIPEANEVINKLPVTKFAPSYNIKNGWTSKERLAIDYGSAIILNDGFN